MNVAPAIAAALESIPPDERSVDVERLTERLVRSSALRLTSIARSMHASRKLPRECVALIFAAVVEDMRA